MDHERNFVYNEVGVIDTEKNTLDKYKRCMGS